MQTYLGLPPQPPDRATYLAIGSFDGIHRGHQALIADMIAAAHAAGCWAGVMTFEPHPLAVLRPDVKLALLSTPAERAQLLSALGADFAVVLPFTRETATTSAADFMATLVERLRLKSLWAGPDFALGRGREGSVEKLAELGERLGYSVQVIAPYDIGEEPVRSSTLRMLLGEQGAVTRAAELLGRPYQVWGSVESGARRGHRLGFPTANLLVSPDRLVPAFGIYACWAWIPDEANQWAAGHPAAVSIGVRPTFDNGAPTIEAFLLDYRGDLYGQPLGLSFIERLRPELRFASADALIAQMHEDVAQTRRILGSPPCEAEVGREGWLEIPHTADWAIRVGGMSQEQLFARAAAAMYTLQDTDPAQPVTLARTMSVTAENPPELIVAWLNRLLLAQELDGEMYTRFRIHEISATGLLGVAYGYHGTPAHTAIKAVTFYDLDVHEDAEGWAATVTFDV